MFVCHAATRRLTVAMGTTYGSNIQHSMTDEHMSDFSAAGPGTSQHELHFALQSTTDVMYCAMQKNSVVVTCLLQTCNMSFPFLQQLLLKRIFNVVYLWKIFNFPYIFNISSFPKTQH